MKKCFKCNSEKPFSDFYKHSQMSDGYVNKCKSCAKLDSLKHRSKNIEKVRAYDRNRPNRKERIKKQSSYFYTDKGKEVRFLAARNYRDKNPLRYKANCAVSNAIRDGRLCRPNYCDKCGIDCKPQGHHDDYKKPLNVRWLCVGCHNKFHNFVREVFRNLEHTGLDNPFINE